MLAHATTRRPVLGIIATLGAALMAAVIVILSFAPEGNAAVTHRPHMYAPSHDQGTVWWNPKRNFTHFNRYRWDGCRSTIYWGFEASIPAGWKASIRSAVNKWDSTTYCGPNWTETTDLSKAKLQFRVVEPTYCNDSTNFIAIACLAQAGTGTNNMLWRVAFNDNREYGVGVGGKFDVESIALNEIGHVMFIDHNTNWTDGVVQANSCTWGSTTCRVKNDLGFADFSEYTVSCTNCGSRRTILPGDWATINHIYGKPTPGTCPSCN